jgi:aspartyl-tRNA synthetase
MHPYREYNCNQLTVRELNKEVKISGWVNAKRNHGDLLFIDLRDHYGITQCVIEASASEEINTFAKIKLESVITVTGKIVRRVTNTINKSLDTGEIELVIKHLHIESMAEQIPFQINDNEKCLEDLRLKYRFLDLRKKDMHNNIIMRSKIISFLRNKMESLGFLDIQTPILTASSPEGARDFLVPSRLNPGKFYALPQAPQQFKQLLMVSGFDKYFQIAPCFRDEDARSDRSPGEFYQLDMEMSFVTQEDIFNIMEPVLQELFEKFSNKKVINNSDGKFPRIKYKEALLKYGSDKPDLRIPIEIADVTDSFSNSNFKIFVNNIKNGAVVRAIKAPKAASKPRKFFDDMIAHAIAQGAGGLAYIIFNEDGTVKSPIAKLLGEDNIKQIKKTANIANGDAVFFACDKENIASNIAGKVRIEIADKCSLIDNNIFRFCWIIDYPYFEKNEETGKIDFSHNPFSMPQGGLKALEEKEPLDIYAYQYDIVCNGIELSSGAIRNHLPEIMYKSFAIAGYDKEQVDKEFSGMINAFKYGAPPHGGIAPGIDRIIMLIAATENIREVIAFPMNGQAQDLLMNAPNIIQNKDLQELNIQLTNKALENIKQNEPKK